MKKQIAEVGEFKRKRNNHIYFIVGRADLRRHIHI
jgi:hypothetical protein